jgi:hypothetical protein
MKQRINTKEEIEKIKNELIDKVDEYFPKIKPLGVNKGRGEALVIIGIALARFEELLTKPSMKGTK